LGDHKSSSSYPLSVAYSRLCRRKYQFFLNPPPLVEDPGRFDRSRDLSLLLPGVRGKKGRVWVVPWQDASPFSANLSPGLGGLGLEGKGISLVAVMILGLAAKMCGSATAKGEQHVVSMKLICLSRNSLASRHSSPCESTGRNGERRPRRSPQGEGGWLRHSSASLCHRYPLRKHWELHLFS
jgi:hypothetical protein